MKQKKTTSHISSQALSFLVAFLASFGFCILFFPKRWFLVDMTRLQTGAQYAPWYYRPFHCDYMPPWDTVYTGSSFCMGIDVRPVFLVPFGLACVFFWIWTHMQKKT